ncbi:MAG: glycosyltransferase family 2 protein, partial [Promethearchaeota archaeon]
MYDGKKIICFTAIYNELHKIDKVLSRIDKTIMDEILVIDDGSTDGSPEIAKSMGATVISFRRNRGAGATIQRAIKYALANKFDVIVLIAGNNKDNPDEILRLLRPIIKENYDFIQGSRFLKGGSYGKMP